MTTDGVQTLKMEQTLKRQPVSRREALNSTAGWGEDGGGLAHEVRLVSPVAAAAAWRSPYWNERRKAVPLPVPCFLLL